MVNFIFLSKDEMERYDLVGNWHNKLIVGKRQKGIWARKLKVSLQSGSDTKLFSLLNK
jgi:hypothetical protein